MDVELDIQKSLYLLDEDYDKASLVPSKLNRGYFSTNEDLSYIKEFNINNQNVLTVCGSGDHSFISLINGAKQVDTFDKNPLQYYLLELKKSAIMGLEKEEYLKYYPIHGGNINEMYNIKYYKKIRDYLHEDAKKYWDAIYTKSNPKLYLLELFSYDLASGSDYTINYELLKKRLFEDNINFYYDDICHISKSLNKNTYKLIILSNICDHIYKNKEYNEKEYIDLVQKNFIPLLTNDGTCVFHYQLNSIDVVSFKDYKGIQGNRVKIMNKSM